MSRKGNLKKIVSQAIQLPLPNEEFVESDEAQAWKSQTGALATLISYKMLSLLYQQEAVQYSLDIPETAGRMQSDLSEMVSHTWNMLDQLKTLTFGSPVWSRISRNEQQVIRDWLTCVDDLLHTFD